MGIRRRCTFGGRGDRSPLAGRCCSGFCCLILAMSTVRRSSNKQARELLPKVQGQVGPKDDDLRKSLLKFIGDFANWDLSSDRTYLEVSRGLVKAAHPEETPLVVDPFAGGGSIPVGGAAAWLRGVRERSQSCCMFDSQGDDRRHPAAWAEARRGTPSCRSGDKEAGGPGTRGASIRRTRTAPRQSPTSGRVLCAVSRRIAAPKFRSCGPFGCARRRAAKEHYGSKPKDEGKEAKLPRLNSKSLSQRVTGRSRAGQ